MPARKRPTNLTGVVATGDRVKSLEALRDVLAARLLASEDDRVVAPIAKQLSDVMRELEALTPPKVTDQVDEQRRKREERRAKVSNRATGSDERRGRSRGAAGSSEPAT